MPPESGSGRQVLTQRSLHGEGPGRFQFGPLTGPGTLTLGLVIPTEVGAGSRLELLDEGGQPKVRLETDCGAGEAEISGVGRFDVDFDVPDTEGDAGCQVRVEPNFRLTTTDRSEPSSGRLEFVAWRPGASEHPKE